MNTAAEMTEKQRLAVQALEGARQGGMPLSEYAKAQGLVIGELYAALAGLRRKGLLSSGVRRKKRGRFVAVRMASGAALPAAMNVVVCRVVQPGCLIECLQWPPASWLAALAPGSADAAS